MKLGRFLVDRTLSKHAVYTPPPPAPGAGTAGIFYYQFYNPNSAIAITIL